MTDWRKRLSALKSADHAKDHLPGVKSLKCCDIGQLNAYPPVGFSVRGRAESH